MSEPAQPSEKFLKMAAQNLVAAKELLRGLLMEMDHLQKRRDECVASANQVGQKCVALMICLGKRENEARKEVREWRNQWSIGSA